MMLLTSKEHAFLTTLREVGNCYVCVSDWTMARNLKDMGMLDIWRTMGGFPACAITEEGCAHLDKSLSQILDEMLEKS